MTAPVGEGVVMVGEAAVEQHETSLSITSGVNSMLRLLSKDDALLRRSDSLVRFVHRNGSVGRR